MGTLFFDTQGNPYQNPNNLLFVEGDQKLDRRHIFKINALYEMAWGIQLSGIYQFLSGQPLLTTGSGGAGVTGAYLRDSARPTTRRSLRARSSRCRSSSRGRGATTRSSSWICESRSARPSGADTTFDLMMDVFNLFNANTVVRVETLDMTLTNFLRPAEIMQPRAARFAFRL